jgi:PIN domain nuclease of toxin-antitoxin system
LPPAARDLIGSPENAIFVSAASLWEIAIKHALNRGRPADMPISAVEARGYFLAAGYSLLPITPQHAVAVESLPALHTDPFDRMLVAQARVEPLRLVTGDEELAGYGDGVLVV